MRLRKVESRAIRLPRDIGAATGRAGSPTKLAAGESSYRWSTVFPCLYSTDFETALVRIETTDGLVGWGEAQAPLAPEVACTIIDRLLKPVLEGQELQPDAEGIAATEQGYADHQGFCEAPGVTLCDREGHVGSPALRRGPSPLDRCPMCRNDDRNHRERTALRPHANA